MKFCRRLLTEKPPSLSSRRSAVTRFTCKWASCCASLRHISIPPPFVPHLYQSDKSPESRAFYDKWTSKARGEKNKLSPDYLHQRFRNTKAVFCVQVPESESGTWALFFRVYFVMTFFVKSKGGDKRLLSNFLSSS